MTNKALVIHKCLPYLDGIKHIHVKHREHGEYMLICMDNEEEAARLAQDLGEQFYITLTIATSTLMPTDVQISKEITILVEGNYGDLEQNSYPEPGNGLDDFIRDLESRLSGLLRYKRGD